MILRTTLLGCIALSAPGSELDEFTRGDRLEHAAAGFAVGFLARELVGEIRPQAKPLEKFLIAAVPVLLLALGKEAWDHEHPRTHDADLRDALATVGGGALSLTLTWRF
jgi:hypothetical protein